MTRDDVERLLRLRRELTHESLNDSTVDAWAAALEDLSFARAKLALMVAVNNGHSRIGVPELRQILKPVEHPATVPAYMTPGHEDHDPNVGPPVRSLAIERTRGEMLAHYRRTGAKAPHELEWINRTLAAEREQR